MGFSISGVQRKGFIGKPRGIELVPKMNVDEKSQYIIKPLLSRFNIPDQSPANEHATMQIAKQLFGIKIAECAFMNFANGTPAYITRRFDYNDNGEKLNQEDFASVLKAANKYNSKTYQDVGEWLSPLNRVEFLRILIFNFLTGNGDVHLKNISLLETADGDMMLSPSYDLMNTKIHLTDNLMALNLFKELEQTSLPLGEKYSYKSEDFIEFGKRLKVKDSITTKIIATFNKKENDILAMVDKSFLSNDAKNMYKNNVMKNYKLFRQTTPIAN
ncbi:HipA domain-containing protein [Flavivirga aquimarina]|uniref:HipA domain-containing protein n=1 Tax=Flavivirga aquimarina TaxID=2027862 RepID=A0ABT8WE70_9FLAO|nr:HipA domain-containing protein [Flavivirga aquimarina]MDO5971307.1 HipA domain-containing protein [Flavivirga aquimarina]